MTKPAVIAEVNPSQKQKLISVLLSGSTIRFSSRACCLLASAARDFLRVLCSGEENLICPTVRVIRLVDAQERRLPKNPPKENSEQGTEDLNVFWQDLELALSRCFVPR